MANYGFSALNKVSSTPSKSPSSNLSKGKGGITYGRVVDIILDDTHPKFEQYGEYASLGSIFYKSPQTPQSDPSVATQGTRAYPYFPNIKHYPLIGEIIPIIFMPSPNIGNNTMDTIPYYLPPSNIWNSPHQNAYPPFTPKPDSQQKSIQQVEEGSPSVVSPTPINLSLGETFVERDNIRPLQPFEGDVILEGRWGNTLRLGSTVTSKPNNWSSSPKCGDPIIILRNGQNSDNPTEPWVPEVEDINTEGSSVYLTSTQAIPILTPFAEEVHSSGKSSYHKFFPTPPSKFIGPQAIISGDRVLINAKTDHVILDAGLTLSFNAQKGFNFDTPKNFVIKTGTTIRLGKEFAPHPLVKGDVMVDLLEDLIKEMTNFVSLFQSVPTPGLEGVKAASTILVPKLQSLKASLPKTKSTKTYTL